MPQTALYIACYWHKPGFTVQSGCTICVRLLIRLRKCLAVSSVHCDCRWHLQIMVHKCQVKSCGWGPYQGKVESSLQLSEAACMPKRRSSLSDIMRWMERRDCLRPSKLHQAKYSPVQVHITKSWATDTKQTSWQMCIAIIFRQQMGNPLLEWSTIPFTFYSKNRERSYKLCIFIQNCSHPNIMFSLDLRVNS